MVVVDEGSETREWDEWTSRGGVTKQLPTLAASSAAAMMAAASVHHHHEELRSARTSPSTAQPRLPFPCLSPTAQAAPPRPWAWSACVGAAPSQRRQSLMANRHALPGRRRSLQRRQPRVRLALKAEYPLVRTICRKHISVHMGQFGHRPLHRSLRCRIGLVRFVSNGHGPGLMS